jgi:tetratricopeptide (TPR) repeat protein
MDESTKKSMQDAFDEGRFADAIQIAEDYLTKEDASDWEAIIMKATILSLPDPKFSDYNTALGVALFGLDNDRTDVRRWVGLGQVFFNCGLYAEAQRCYRTALETDPANYDAVMELAVLQRFSWPGLRVGADELKVLLEKAISNQPHNWRGYFYLAKVLRSQGAKNPAMAMYKLAIDRLADEERIRLGSAVEKEVLDLEEEVAVFGRISGELESFASTHNLMIDKRYFNASAWALCFRHPKGGIGKIVVRKYAKDQVTVSALWMMNDYLQSLSFLKATEDRKCSLDHLQLRAVLTEMLKLTLSWEIKDMNKRRFKKPGYDTISEEAFQREYDNYPIPTLD